MIASRKRKHDDDDEPCPSPPPHTQSGQRMLLTTCGKLKAYYDCLNDRLFCLYCYCEIQSSDTPSIFAYLTNHFIFEQGSGLEECFKCHRCLVSILPIEDCAECINLYDTIISNQLLNGASTVDINSSLKRINHP